MLTDAELDHRAEVARLDGNYLALELIRELRAARAAALSPADVEALGDARAAVKLYRRIENTRALLALHTRVKAMAAVVAAAERTADEMEHDVSIAERHRVVCREGGQHVGTGGQLGALPPSGLSAVRRYAQSLRAALDGYRGAK